MLRIYIEVGDMHPPATRVHAAPEKSVFSYWPEFLASIIGYASVAVVPVVLFGLILVATFAAQ